MKKSRKPMSAARRLALSNAAHYRLYDRYSLVGRFMDGRKADYHYDVRQLQKKQNRILSKSERQKIWRSGLI